MLFAVVKTKDGKQHRVVANSIINVEKINEVVGNEVSLDTVLVSNERGEVVLGNRVVKAEVLSHNRDKKIIVYKKKRRKGYSRKQGHRQHFTSLRIKEINI